MTSELLNTLSDIGLSIVLYGIFSPQFIFNNKSSLLISCASMCCIYPLSLHEVPITYQFQCPLSIFGYAQVVHYLALYYCCLSQQSTMSYWAAAQEQLQQIASLCRNCIIQVCVSAPFESHTIMKLPNDIPQNVPLSLSNA